MSVQPAIFNGNISDGSGLAQTVADIRRRLGRVEANRTMIGDGAIVGGQISSGSIGTGHITLGAITAELISALAINAGHIQANAITSNHIAANTIVAGDIAANTITSALIATGAIQAGHIEAGAVITDKLAASSVVADKIATNAVTTDKLAAGAVTATKMTITGGLSSITADLGSITAGTIQGATIQTSGSGSRVVMNSSGLSGYALDGTTKTFEINTGTGVASFTGVAQLSPGSVIPNIGGGNLLPDSSFESGIMPAGTIQAATGTIDTTKAYDGSKSFKMVSIVSASSTALFTAQNDYIPVKPGDKLTGSVYVYPDTVGRASYVEFQWLQADKTTHISYSGTGFTVPTMTAGTWNRTITRGMVAPALAGWARPIVRIHPTALGVAGEAHYVDAWQVERGEIETAYAPKGELLPGSINYGHLTNVAFGGANLLKNSSFEDAIDPLFRWSLYNNGLSPAPTLDTIVNTTSKHGTRIARLTNSTDVAGDMGISTGSNAAYPVPVEAGKTYTLSVYGQPATSGGNFKVHIGWYTSAGGALGSSSGNLVTGVSGAWTRAMITGTAPATAAKAYIYAWVNNPTSGFVFYFDAFQLEEGELETSYSPTAGEGDLPTGSVRGFHFGGAMGGGNLIPNSSFEQGLDAAGVDRWSEGWAASGSTLNKYTTTAFHGSTCVRVDATSVNSGYVGRNAGADRIPVVEGVPYTFSAWAKSLSGNVNGHYGQVYLEWYNAGGTIISSAGPDGNVRPTHIGTNVRGVPTYNSGELLSTTDWRRIALTMVAPPTATALRCYFRYYGGPVGGLNVIGDQVLVDAIQLEQGELPSAYQPKTDEILYQRVNTVQLAAGAVTANTVAAGAITAQKLSFTSTSQNMQLDAGFEYPLTGTPVWANSGGGIYGIATTTPRSGTQIGTITVTGTPTTASVANNANLTRMPIVAAGKSYVFSVYVRQAAALANRSGRLFIEYLDAASALLGTINGTVTALPADNTTWTRLTVSGVAPTNSLRARLTIRYQSTDATPMTAGQVLHLDEAMLEPGETPAAMFEYKANDLQPGSVGNTQITADAVTTDKILAGTILGSDIAATTITAGNIAASTITATQIASGTITATQLSATAIDAMTITGATIRTAGPTVAPRTQMDSAGLRTYFPLVVPNYLSAGGWNDSVGLPVTPTQYLYMGVTYSDENDIETPLYIQTTSWVTRNNVGDGFGNIWMKPDKRAVKFNLYVGISMIAGTPPSNSAFTYKKTYTLTDIGYAIWPADHTPWPLRWRDSEILERHPDQAALTLDSFTSGVTPPPVSNLTQTVGVNLTSSVPLITGADIRTAVRGSRLELNSTGLQTYNYLNQSPVQIKTDGASGAIDLAAPYRDLPRIMARPAPGFMGFRWTAPTENTVRWLAAPGDINPMANLVAYREGEETRSGPSSYTYTRYARLSVASDSAGEGLTAGITIQHVENTGISSVRAWSGDDMGALEKTIIDREGKSSFVMNDNALGRYLIRGPYFPAFSIGGVAGGSYVDATHNHGMDRDTSYIPVMIPYGPGGDRISFSQLSRGTHACTIRFANNYGAAVGAFTVDGFYLVVSPYAV